MTEQEYKKGKFTIRFGEFILILIWVYSFFEQISNNILFGVILILAIIAKLELKLYIHKKEEEKELIDNIGKEE